MGQELPRQFTRTCVDGERLFLPDMLKRDHGVFACVSSTGTAFLGGYETFKAAQVHLANTLDAELEGTNVIAYTIGPGLVPTETASKAVSQLAPQMGMSVEQFFEMNKGAVLICRRGGCWVCVVSSLCREIPRAGDFVHAGVEGGGY
jgi:NAD(P)-dependent dehydrogenase (short-subunit alcohol dehydrogenase family)